MLATTSFIVYQILLLLIPLVCMVFVSENHRKKLATSQSSMWYFIETHLTKKLQRNSVKTFEGVIVPTLFTEVLRAPLLVLIMVSAILYGKKLTLYSNNDGYFLGLFMGGLFISCLVGWFVSEKAKFSGTVLFEIWISVCVAINIMLFYDMQHSVDSLGIILLKASGLTFTNLVVVSYTRLYMWLINAKVLR